MGQSCSKISKMKIKYLHKSRRQFILQESLQHTHIFCCVNLQISYSLCGQHEYVRIRFYEHQLNGILINNLQLKPESLQNFMCSHVYRKHPFFRTQTTHVRNIITASLAMYTYDAHFPFIHQDHQEIHIQYFFMYDFFFVDETWHDRKIN